MAMINYGAIAFKNGKLISKDFFTPMEDTCGFSDKGTKKYSFDGNCFVICGDKDLFIGFYKCWMAWESKDELECKEEYREYKTYEGFNNTEYKGWKKWGSRILWTDSSNSEGHSTKIMVKPRNGYFIATWEYKGDKYKVYFGYGVDLGLYKKYRLVNYYRGLPHLFIRIKRIFTFYIPCWRKMYGRH